MRIGDEEISSWRGENGNIILGCCAWSVGFARPTRGWKELVGTHSDDPVNGKGDKVEGRTGFLLCVKVVSLQMGANFRRGMDLYVLQQLEFEVRQRGDLGRGRHPMGDGEGGEREDGGGRRVSTCAWLPLICSVTPQSETLKTTHW